MACKESRKYKIMKEVFYVKCPNCDDNYIVDELCAIDIQCMHCGYEYKQDEHSVPMWEWVYKRVKSVSM